MANLFKALKPHADLGHSVFDLSQKHVFSSKSGMADAVCPFEVVPDDHFQINVGSLHRTMTMNTAAFLRGKFRYDFFFVPYTQIWHNFNQFIDQRKDKHSTRFNDFNFCPVFNVGALLYLGLQSFRKFHWNQANVITQDCDIYGVPFIFGLVRILDMLGYGNYSPILIPTEPINPATGAAWSGTERDDAFTAALAYAAQFDDKFCNLFRIAAYQHIWYDYYRNKYYDEQWEFGSLYMDYINTFNFDDIICNVFSNSILSYPALTYNDSDAAWQNGQTLRVLQLFTPRYVQWKKDLFTSTLPGTQFGSVSTVDFTSVTSDDTSRWNNQGGVFVNGESVKTEAKGTYIGDLAGSSMYGLQHDHEFTASFDVLALKRAEALQAWKQATLRAGNMVDSNFEAHFGVKPHYEGDNNVAFLGSYEAILDVNSVVANADTSGSINGRVGDIAATGTAVLKGQTINYDAKDFGVIMAIASFVPESEYSNNMIDRANRLYEKFDFFTPEYQNIGLESVSGVDLDANLFSNEANKVLGYAPRYWMYKAAVDKCHGEFARVPYQVANQPIKEIQGTLRAWVAPRKEFLIMSGFDSSGYHVKNRTKGTFYCSPYALDNVFGLQNYNDLNSLGRQRTDSFLNNVYFDIKAVRPMSVLGLPQF